MKKLGQHFLTNKAVLQKIAQAIEPAAGEVLIEIGPGHGELTFVLTALEPSAKIIAIEKDEALAEKLHQKFSQSDLDESLGVSPLIISGDVRLLLKDIVRDHVARSDSYVIFGNIPYYLTSYLLRLISELERKPRVCVFMVQREVALRIAAAAPKMNKLAASVQFWATPTLLATVPKKDFRPAPTVDSAVIKLVVHAEPCDQESYYATIQTLFQQPRKTIINNLLQQKEQRSASTLTRPHLEKFLASLNLKPESRPQDLSIEAIVKLTEALSFEENNKIKNN